MPVGVVGRVIGSGGRTLRELEARHGCRARVDNGSLRDGCKTLICEGPEPAVIDLIQEARRIAHMQVEERVHIPLATARLILGNGGHIVRAVVRNFHVKIDVRDPVGLAPTREAVITGYQAEGVAQARLALEALAPHGPAAVPAGWTQTHFCIPTSLDAHMLEAGHPKLAALCAESSCDVVLGMEVPGYELRRVVIRGPEARVPLAEGLVWGALGVIAQRRYNGCPSCVFDVPNADNDLGDCPCGQKFSVRCVMHVARDCCAP